MLAVKFSYCGFNSYPLVLAENVIVRSSASVLKFHGVIATVSLPKTIAAALPPLSGNNVVLTPARGGKASHASYLKPGLMVVPIALIGPAVTFLKIPSSFTVSLSATPVKSLY